jgi:hypothetical protein
MSGITQLDEAKNENNAAQICRLQDAHGIIVGRPFQIKCRRMATRRQNQLAKLFPDKP